MTGCCLNIGTQWPPSAILHGFLIACKLTVGCKMIYYKAKGLKPKYLHFLLTNSAHSWLFFNHKLIFFILDSEKLLILKLYDITNCLEYAFSHWIWLCKTKIEKSSGSWLYAYTIYCNRANIVISFDVHKVHI